MALSSAAKTSAAALATVDDLVVTTAVTAHAAYLPECLGAE